MLRSIAYVGLLLASLGAMATGATACEGKVRISFFEDSPDHFLVEFKDRARVQITSLHIDLRSSVGRAFIDTAYGSETPSDANGVVLAGSIGFVDGSREWTLTFKRFLPGQKFTLLVDLDDAAVFDAGDPDHLTDGELEGARAEARLVAPDGKVQTISGLFDKQGVATLGRDACA